MVKAGLLVTVLSLVLTIAQACPYLAREEKQKRRYLQGNAVTPATAAAPAAAPPTTSKSAIDSQKLDHDVKSKAVTFMHNPSCFAAAFLFKYPTCIAGAIQVASAFIREQITNVDGMAAKFVRLSFHDCVGGCDGCVDLSNPSNFGLEAPIDALAPIVELTKRYLTTGDVWALAGTVACRMSQKGSSLAFPMQFIQRPQCAGNATKAGPHRELPSVHFTTKEVLDYFKNNFDFTPKETVAILGAHTMGKAASENSGFGGEGGWDPEPAELNNNYYKELLDFKQFGLDFEENEDFPPFPNQFYWEEEVEEGEPDGTFMLHADMALAFNLKGYVNSTNGNVTCTLVHHPGKTLCPSSFLRPQAEIYANDNDLWVKDFMNVYLKMISTGCGDGRCTSIVE